MEKYQDLLLPHVICYISIEPKQNYLRSNCVICKQDFGDSLFQEALNVLGEYNLSPQSENEMGLDTWQSDLAKPEMSIT